jgi:ATP-dependent DNA helicase PIF1
VSAILLQRGRAAYSLFKIPVNITEDDKFEIEEGSNLLELMKRTKLILWDEAQMAKKRVLRENRQSLRELTNYKCKENENRPFAGIIVVLGGDFRQLLPKVHTKLVARAICAGHLASYNKTTILISFSLIYATCFLYTYDFAYQ